MSSLLCFEVQGQAVPKQSFRYARGRSFQTAAVREWQNAVAWAAKQQLGNVMLSGDLRVKIQFLLQRHLRIGYPRAARLMTELEKLGVIGKGPNPNFPAEREVLIEKGVEE